jgi:predicted nucleic-acid-binding Zn-ribbon protein
MAMKISGVCPKCHHNRLLHVAQIPDRVGDLGGIRIDDGSNPDPIVGEFYPWRIARLRNPGGGYFTPHVKAAGLVEAFICRACGLTELYTRDPENIEVDGELVREVVGPPAQGPFR